MRIRYGLQTLVRLYAIRRAYGVYKLSLHAVVALCGLSLFLILSAMLMGAARMGPLPDEKLSRAALFSKADDKDFISLSWKDSISLADSSVRVPYSMVVDKTRKTLMVYANAGGRWSLIRTYLIVTGERPGRKEVEGDLRTPEGLYWIVGERYREELDTSMYGDHAYVLNYPNRFDLAAGRTGGGIWIHGTNRPISRGCVAMLKHELLEMAQFARRGTPVYIAEQTGNGNFASFVGWESLAAERDSALASPVRREEELVEFVRTWKRAWQAANVAEYQRNYSASRFFSRGMGYQQWMDYKGALFERQRGNIEITLANFEIPSADSSRARIRFRQTYRSPTQSSRSRKELLVVWEGDEWKIAQEQVLSR